MGAQMRIVFAQEELPCGLGIFSRCVKVACSSHADKLHKNVLYEIIHTNKENQEFYFRKFNSHIREANGRNVVGCGGLAIHTFPFALAIFLFVQNILCQSKKKNCKSKASYAILRRILILLNAGKKIIF